MLLHIFTPNILSLKLSAHNQICFLRYSFTLEFYLPISKDFTYELTDREVRIKLTKKEPDWWPRLLYEQKKLPWLRVDFDRIK